MTRVASKKRKRARAPVNHDPRRQARLGKRLGSLQDVLGRVIWSAVGAAKDHVAGGVSVRLDDCEEDRSGGLSQSRRSKAYWQRCPGEGEMDQREIYATVWVKLVTCFVTERKL